MNEVCEIFTSLVGRDMDLDIELGDNSKYSIVELGIVAFRRGSDDLLRGEGNAIHYGVDKELVISLLDGR